MQTLGSGFFGGIKQYIDKRTSPTGFAFVVFFFVSFIIRVVAVYSDVCNKHMVYVVYIKAKR